MGWEHTTFGDQEHITKFRDRHTNRWHKFSYKNPQGRSPEYRAGKIINPSRAVEYGRKPYMDSANWGVTRPSVTIKRLKRDRSIPIEK